MRYVPVLLVGLIGAGVLIALGVWQVQRLEWKSGVLAEIDKKIAADPVALPRNVDPERDRYLPVQISGRTGARELHVLVSTRAQGAGFRIITALETDDERRILLDQGYVPNTAKDAERPPSKVSVIGNLHWPQERDSYTPQNDPEANYWYARDVDVMARELGTEPVLVIARETSGGNDTLPIPVDTSGIPNDHLGYAVTWFGLAAVWLGMTVLLLWRMARRTRSGPG